MECNSIFHLYMVSHVCGFRSGIYKDCRMRFNVYLNAASYPHETPVVQMLDTVAHPNVDFFHSDCHYDESNICLSVLDDWNDEGEWCMKNKFYILP